MKQSPAKTVLITGAASRLGAPLTQAFARDGFRVVLHANHSLEEALRLSQGLNDAGLSTEALRGDFGGRATIEAFCETLISRFGAPDVIVNNASVFQHDFPGAGDAGMLAESLCVHAMAPFLLLEAAAKAKAPETSLTVFNILDQKLLNLNPDYYSYTLGKSALMALTSLWQSAGRSDIRVFGLLPGLMFPSGPQSDARFAADAAKIPTGRVSHPDEIFALMQFYLSHSQLPGQMLPIDGGEHLLGRLRDVAFE